MPPADSGQPAPTPTPIYHITHVDNLPLILADGGLRCCADLRSSSVRYRDIAYQDLQAWRAQRRVPSAPGGVLHDYVPFYFAPRSPMLCAIAYGRVPHYSEGQGPIVHLVSTVQATLAAGHSFVFTDGHTRVAVTDYFNDVADLDRIDWSVMPLKFWKDTNARPDCERRRQAEFLVRSFFPWTLITEIGVKDLATKRKVQEILWFEEHEPEVNVRGSSWYY
jgi:hypothetical protein